MPTMTGTVNIIPKQVVSKREINDVMFERVWKVEHVVQLTAVETRIDGEPSPILKTMTVGMFEDEDQVLKFIEGTGDTLISIGAYPEEA